MVRIIYGFTGLMILAVVLTFTWLVGEIVQDGLIPWYRRKFRGIK